MPEPPLARTAIGGSRTQDQTAYKLLARRDRWCTSTTAGELSVRRTLAHGSVSTCTKVFLASPLAEHNVHLLHVWRTNPRDKDLGTLHPLRLEGQALLLCPGRWLGPRSGNSMRRNAGPNLAWASRRITNAQLLRLKKPTRGDGIPPIVATCPRITILYPVLWVSFKEELVVRVLPVRKESDWNKVFLPLLRLLDLDRWLLGWDYWLLGMNCCKLRAIISSFNSACRVAHPTSACMQIKPIGFCVVRRNELIKEVLLTFRPEPRFNWKGTDRNCLSRPSFQGIPDAVCAAVRNWTELAMLERTF